MTEHPLLNPVLHPEADLTISCMCMLGLGGNYGGNTSLYIAEAKVCYVERSTKVHSLSRIFAGP